MGGWGYWDCHHYAWATVCPAIAHGGSNSILVACRYNLPPVAPFTASNHHFITNLILFLFFFLLSVFVLRLPNNGAWPWAFWWHFWVFVYSCEVMTMMVLGNDGFYREMVKVFWCFNEVIEILGFGDWRMGVVIVVEEEILGVISKEFMVAMRCSRFFF